MWVHRQRQHPVLRFTAAVLTSLWLVAVLVCSMHCAGLLSAGSFDSGSCCHRSPPKAKANVAGTKSLPKPSDSRDTTTCECLKAYAPSESAPFSLPPLDRLPQTFELTPVLVSIRLSTSQQDLDEERHRCVQPAFLLGRGLRTHAPPRVAV